MKKRTLVPLAALTLAAGFALAGCTVTGPTENFSGLPELEHGSEGEHGAEGDHAEDTGVQVFWLQEGSQIAVSISGSSTCPVIGSDIKVIEPAGEGNVVEITTVPIPADKICTMDYAPHTSVFWTPPKVTTTEPLTIRVADQELELATK